ncbi:MAG: dgkA [Myxococcales bacterium]|nr:dgkA [Myxococcales bacterium]
MLLQAGVRQRVAVILNENARGVRQSIIDDLTELVPPHDLYLSRSVHQSRQIAAKVVERAYDTILFGGGDGTFVQCLSDVAAESQARDMALPSIGVLRLGTGNALADCLGASRPTLDGLAHDLGRARRANRARSLQLLEVEGKLTPFAGCGLDAQILDDFQAMGKLIDRFAGPLAPAIGAAPRYALTVGLRSTPRFLTKTLPEIEVINTGAPVYPIYWRNGRVLEDEAIATGDVVWRGRASLASCSTIPNFGLGMRMFPWSDAREGRFQLRCSTASAYETIRNLPAVFRGEYRTPTLIDFLCTSVEIRMERPVPVQVGGDLQDGARDRLRVEMSDKPIRVLA